MITSKQIVIYLTDTDLFVLGNLNALLNSGLPNTDIDSPVTIEQLKQTSKTTEGSSLHSVKTEDASLGKQFSDVYF